MSETLRKAEAELELREKKINELSRHKVTRDASMIMSWAGLGWFVLLVLREQEQHESPADGHEQM